MSYRRIGASAQATAQGGVQIRSTSNFTGETIDAFAAGDTAADFPNLQPGVEFNPNPINIDMHKRFVWIGATAMREDGSSAWYFIGRLCFWLGASIMLQIPIRAGGHTAPGYGSSARRFAGGGGSQPPINFRYIGSELYSADVPCFTFTVRANRISLIPDQMDLQLTTGNAYVMGFMLVSQNETI